MTNELFFLMDCWIKIGHKNKKIRPKELIIPIELRTFSFVSGKFLHKFFNSDKSDNKWLDIGRNKLTIFNPYISEVIEGLSLAIFSEINKCFIISSEPKDKLKIIKKININGKNRLKIFLFFKIKFLWNKKIRNKINKKINEKYR